MKKIVYLLLAFLYTVNSILAYTPSCSTVGSLPYGASWISPNKVVGTQVLGNDNTLLTPIDTICGTDLRLLPGKADNETITGAWTFTPACTFNGGVTFGGDDGVNNTSLLIDADNSGAEVDTKILFQRGSTATDSEIRWDSTDDRFELYTDGSTLSDVQVGNCDSTGEACNFDDVVLDTTNQTVAGVKTYSSAIIQSTECTSSNELCTKSYIDVADSAITAGGCSYGTSVPVGACMQGACYNLSTSSGAIVHYVCTSSGYVATNPYFDSSATFTMSITLSSSGNSITGTPTITGNTQVTGNLTVTGTFALSSSGFNASNVRLQNVADPTSAQDALTLNYFNTHSTKVFSQTSDVTISNTTTETSLVGSGVGSATISANTLAVGSHIRVKARGYLTNTSGSTKTATIRLYFGGSVVQSNSTPSFISDANTQGGWDIDWEMTVRSTGAAGTVQSQGRFIHVNSGSPSNGTVVANLHDESIDYINTTTGQAINITWQWSGAHSNTTVVCTNLVIEVLP